MRQHGTATLTILLLIGGSSALAQPVPTDDHDPETPAPRLPDFAAKPPPAPARPIVDPKLLPLLRQLARPRLPEARRASLARQLGRAGDPFVLQPLLKLCRDSSVRVRRAAAEGLGLLRDVGALRELYRLIENDRTSVARAALLALGRYPAPTVRRYLTRLAVSADRQLVLRMAALQALQRHGTNQARMAILGLSRGSGLVARAAAAILGRRCARCTDEPQEALLLRILLGQTPPHRRARALRRLVREQPRRALPVLLFAADDDSDEVRREALTRLGAYPDAAAEARLVEALEHGSPAEREIALAQLRGRSTPRVREALARAASLASRPTSQPGPRDNAVAPPASGPTSRPGPRVAAASPQPAAEIEVSPARPPERARSSRGPDRSGYIPLMAAAAAAGAGGLYAIAAGAEGEYAWIAGVSGGVLGGGTAALLNLKGDVTLRDALAFSTVAGWSVEAGLQGGLAAGLGRELAWPVLSADILGVTGAIFATKQRWSDGDLAFVNFSALQGSVAGLGLSALAFPGGSEGVGERVADGLMSGLLPAAALTAATLGTGRVQLSGRDYGLLTHGGFFGGTVGGLLVPAIVRDPQVGQVAGGIALGEALGYAGGVLAAQYSELAAAEQGWMWLSSTALTTAGGGLGLLVSDLRGRPGYAAASIGAGLGLTLGALGHDTFALRQRDIPLTALGAGYGAWVGGWLPYLIYNEGPEIDATAAAGGALLAGFTGTLAGDMVSRLTDVPGRTVGLAALSTVASTAAVGGAGLMLGGRPNALKVGVMHGVSTVGLAAGAVLAPHLRFSAGDIGLTSLTSAHAAASLGMLPALWRGDDEGLTPREVAGGLLAGSGLGLLVGMGVSQGAELSGDDVGELAAWSGGGFALGAGAGLLADRGRRVAVGLTEGVSAAGLAAGAVLAPRLRYSGRDRLLLSQLALGGALQGAFLPDLWRGEADRPAARVRIGGVLAASSTGLLAGALLAQRTEVDPRDVGEMALSLAAGDLLGAGAGLLAGLGSRNTSRLMQGVGLASWLAGSLRAPHTRHTGRDGLLMTQLAAGGALQGAFLPDLWHDDAIDGKTRAGGAMALGATGMILGSLVAQRTEVDPRDVGEMALSLAAGDLLGGGVGLLAELSQSNTVRLMQGVGLASWVAGSLRAPYTRHSDRDALLMAQLSAGGALQGAFLPVLWDTDEIDDTSRAGGAMALGSAGLIAGSLIAQRSEVAPGDVGEMSLALAAGDLLGAGTGLLADLSQSNTVRVMEGVGLATWVAGSLRAPYTEHSGRDAFFTAELAAGGALQGTMLPDLWHAGDDEVAGSERAGGAMVGASLGLVAGSLLSQRSEVAPGDVGEMALALTVGDALGAGIGLAGQLGQRTTLRLMQAVGTATWIAGGLRAPGTHYTGRDVATIGLLSGYGALLGGWMPVWESGHLGDVTAGQVSGGLLAGAAAGTIVGSLVAPRIELKGAAVAELGLSSVGWGMFGAGLGLMIPTDDDRVPIGLMQGLGLAGTVGSAFLVDRTDFSSPDRVLTTLTAAFGAWQGAGTSLLFEASGRQIAGAVMATVGLGGFAGAAASQYIDLTHGEVWTLFSGSVWGATLGVLSANVANDFGSKLSTGQQIGITTLASDVGLALGGLALSPLLGWSAKRIGYVNLFGLGGVALGAAIGGPIHSRIGTKIGVVAGSLAGLASGVIVSGKLGLGDPAPAEAAESGPGGALAHRATTSSNKRRRAPRNALSRRLPAIIADWTPAVMTEPDIDPDTGEQRSVRVIFGVRGKLH